MINMGMGLAKESALNIYILPISPLPQSSALSRKNALENFRNSYQCAETISVFGSYIERCHSAFMKGQCFAPYFVLAQSSGSGKTRLLLEASHYQPIVYINCRMVQDRPSSVVVEYIMDKLIDFKSEDQNSWLDANKLDTFILKTAYKLCDFFEALFCWLFKYLLSVFCTESLDFPDAARKMHEMTKSFFDPTISENFWQDVIRKYELKSYNIENLFREHVGHPYFSWLKSKIVTLAFDEASFFVYAIENPVTPRNGRGFAVPLRIIRRAVRIFKKKNPDNFLAFILTGTTSKLANFVPVFKNDSSIRESSTSYRLFPPFILKYQDSYVPDYMRTLMVAENLYEEIKNRPNDNKFYFLGRPLWGAEFENHKCTIPELVNLAIIKLLGTNESDFGWFGTLLVRVAIQVNPMLRAADDLVAVNMATLQEFCQNENALLISYISEPILAVAASKLMMKRTKSLKPPSPILEPEPASEPTPEPKPKLPSIRKNVLKSLSSVTNFEMANVGSRGEYVFQLICVDAVDKLTNHDPVQPIKLSDFIAEVFGDEALNKMKKLIDIENCLMSLLQFKYLEYKMDQDSLKIALIRGLGLVAKMNNPGFDLCIPFIRSNNEVSGLFIEVKNTSKRFSGRTSKIRKLKLEVDQINQSGIKILINLRRGKSSSNPQSLPTCDILTQFQIFHVDFLFNGSRFPNEYRRLLKEPTRFKQIASLRKKNDPQRKEPTYFDSFLDLGLTCLPFKKLASILDSAIDRTVPAVPAVSAVPAVPAVSAVCTSNRTTSKRGRGRGRGASKISVKPVITSKRGRGDASSIKRKPAT